MTMENLQDSLSLKVGVQKTIDKLLSLLLYPSLKGADI